MIIIRICIVLTALNFLTSCKTKHNRILPTDSIKLAKFCEEYPASPTSQVPERIKDLLPLFHELGVTDYKMRMNKDRILFYFKKKIETLPKEKALQIVSEDYLALLGWTKNEQFKKMLTSKHIEERELAQGAIRVENAIFAEITSSDIDAYYESIIRSE